MPNTFTPTATALTTVTEPVDGENRNVASVTTMTRAIANGVAFNTAQSNPLADLTALAAITAPANGLVRHVIGFGLYVFQTSATTGLSPFRVAATDATAGGWVASHAHQTTQTRLVSVANMAIPWVLSAATTPYTTGQINIPQVPAAAVADMQVLEGKLVVNTAVSTGSNIAKSLRFGIDQYLVDGATLSSITMRLTGASAHVGLPGLMPQFGVIRYDLDGSAGTSVNLLTTGLGLAADASGTTTAYQAAHSVVFTPNQNNVIDKTQYSYSLIFWNEGGANALVGLSINSFAFAHTAIPDARRS